MEVSATKKIIDFLDKKGISKTKLGELIGQSRQNITKKLAKNDIDVGLLYKISIALEYDFFSEISKQLPKEVRKEQPVLNSSEIERALINFIEARYPKIKDK